MGRKVVDLFCGAGGMSLGLKHAGFTPIVGVDLDEKALATYQRNLKVPTLRADISSPMSFTKIQQICSKHRLYAVAGGPPCQGFSKANVHKASRDNRVHMPVAFARLAVALSPNVIIMEEVPEFKRKFGGKMRDSVIAILKEAGYIHIVEANLKATDYGAATTRRRYFMVASKSQTHMPSSWPPPATVAVPKSVKQAWLENPPLVRSADARPHRLAISASAQSKLRAHQLNPRLETPYFSGSYKPLILSKPAPTLTTFCDAPGSGRFSVPTRTGFRRLTVHEAKVIHGFPSNFYFMKPEGAMDIPSSAYTQIGNSVSPRMSLAVGLSLSRTSS